MFATVAKAHEIRIASLSLDYTLTSLSALHGSELTGTHLFFAAVQLNYILTNVFIQLMLCMRDQARCQATRLVNLFTDNIFLNIGV